ncbi:MAG TPA: hypothetical protein VGA99_12250 [bacterium]
MKTGTGDGFQIYGGSITADVSITPNLLWRLEARLLKNKDVILSNRFGKIIEDDGLLVTSFALKL